jgi:putative ABC transport system permease protein
MPTHLARLRAMTGRIIGLIRRDEMNLRLEEEMRVHVEMQTERNVRDGMPPAGARRAALLAFGGRQRHTEDARDAWRSRLVEETVRDARFAARSLRRSPTFTAAVILSLGIGIGATSTVYTVTERVVLRPLPYGRDGELAMLWSRVENDPGAINMASFADYSDLVTNNRDVEHSAAFSVWLATLSGAGSPEQLVGSRVSADFFPTLGMAPMLGRGFRPDEDIPGAPNVAVLAYSAWQRRFAGDSSIVGRLIKLNGVPYTVIGVMPSTFRDPEPAFKQRAEVWRPLNLTPATQPRGARYLRTIVRLRPGVTVEKAQRDFDVITQRLARSYPETNRDRGVHVVSMQEQVVGGSRPILFAVLGAAACLLLIVCGNVASLVMARHLVRSTEIALRTAMGAPGERVARMLFIESLILSLGGGAVALAITAAATGALRRIAPPDVPRVNEIAIDPRALGVTMLVTLGAALLFGLAPAIRASRADLASMLRDGGRRFTATSRSRGAIVVAELALSLVLLASAGLLTKSLIRLTAVPTGLDVQGVLSFRVTLPMARYPSDAARRVFFNALERRIGAESGVAAAATVSAVPFTQINDNIMRVAGDERSPQPAGFRLMRRSASPGYFRLMRIPILAGREFTASDTVGAPPVAVITRAAAMRIFATENAIGRRIIEDIGDTTRLTVIGVVADVRFNGPVDNTEPELFRPEEQLPWMSNAIAVRAQHDPLELIPRMRAAVQSLDADIAVADPRPMVDLLAAYRARQRFYAAVFGLFAMTALMLSAIGIYGVIAYVVAQQRKEIAVRMALGAQTRDILRRFVGQALALTGFGMTIGVVGSLAAARAIQTLLFDVGPGDVTTLIGSACALAAIGVAASAVPALRATRISPAETLRRD